tara:strand:- start:185 stop:865 length:681 start_codon:yes stop_codon:yes gene_type:complete
MTISDHANLMTMCEEQLEHVGVAQKGGKKYMMVKDRMTFFRRAYGLKFGISTALVASDDLRVQVQALVTDDAGRTIGSGLAEEMRGFGVNKASALENCESSAIGRALASLGLHGGEYPTADEIESDRRSSKAIDERPPAPAAPVKGPNLISEDIPFLESETIADWPSWVSEQIAGMPKHRHLGEHQAWLGATKPVREALKRENNAEWVRLKNAYEARRAEMLNKKG